MTERTCGECYRCCVAFGIPELRKYQDQSCRHLDGRNPKARCSIYGDRPTCCREYLCLWREGHFDEDDRPDKGGVIAHFSQLESGRIELNLTIDDRNKDVGGNDKPNSRVGSR
jgi:Fe-S-cluster containining protein